MAFNRFLYYFFPMSQPLISLTPRKEVNPSPSMSTRVGACFTPYWLTSSLFSLAFSGV